MASAAAAEHTVGPATPFQSPTFETDATVNVKEEYTAASISPSGRDVVLAGTQGILIIDLDNLDSSPRYIRYRIGFEVADVQWSPFASRAEWIASTNNNKAIIFNLNFKPSLHEAPIQYTLDSHQGNITDINFSAHHPDVLATCALDTYVFTWDLRAPQAAASTLTSTRRAPSVSFADWQGGATQVKWNRKNEFILASSHDRYVQVWDVRHGARPISTIHAHFNKVYGIDWHRSEATKILTCSLDKTVKQWDQIGVAEDISEPSRTIFTDYPLLRARHTPFSNGIIAMPQHGSASLGLFKQTTDDPGDKISNLPAHVFRNDAVDDRLYEFLWRSRGDCDDGFDHREFQLVTWATDHKLRLHSVSPSTLKQAVNFEKGCRVDEEPSRTRKGAQYISFRDGMTSVSDAGHTNRSQDGLAPTGALSSLFKNRPPGRIGINKLYQGEPRRTTMTARSVRRNTTQRIVNHVTWMHNVNIGKRKLDEDGQILETDHQERHNHREEILAVDKKYPNVNFEKFEQPSHAVVVSLKGPWGEAENTPYPSQPPARKLVFLRLTIRLPEKYPNVEEIFDDAEHSLYTQTHPLEIIFEKTTAAINPVVVDHLKASIEHITEAYARKAQPALDAVISYALGDEDLDDVIAKAKDPDRPKLVPDPDLEPLVGTPHDQESESEEEDDSEAGEFSNDLMHSSHSNANIPLPAQTIARFSNTGHLVTASILRTGPTVGSSTFLTDPIRLPRHLLRNPSKDDIFETFGRIATGPGSESPTSSLISWESSSSPSSSGSEHEADIRFKDFLPPLAWQKVSSRSHAKTSVPSSADPSHLMNTNKTRSIVTIQRSAIDEFVPSKKVLAEEYMIFGDGPTVCLHNSVVAKKHGFEDLADVWQLCRLILNNQVPLEILPQQHRREQVLVVARRALVRIQRKDSGLDLQYDGADTVINPKLRGRVKWGHHTVVSWLIPALFDHFERLADTQMLAMLSCVFSEPAAREGIPNAMAKMTQAHLPMSMEAPAFSLDYFASPDAAWSLFKPTISVPSTPAHLRYATPAHEFGKHRPSKNLDTYGSHGSSNGPWGSDTLASDPVTPYSTGDTPPILSQAPTFRSATTTNTPFSTSPEQSQTASRKMPSTGFSNALATLGKTLYSSSPPVKSRVDDLSTSAPTSGVTWGATTFYGSGSHERVFATQRAKHEKRASFGQAEKVNIDYDSTSDSEYDDSTPDGASEHMGPVTPGLDTTNDSSRIKITLKNQDKFDDEACVSAPLLDLSNEWLYRAWRKQYAEMLGCWDLISKRAEVLKFNGLTAYFPTEEAPRDISMQLALKKEGKKDDFAPPSQRLSRTASLAPPDTSLSARRSPMVSPHHFSFNPEALEFKPGSSFNTPVDQSPAPQAQTDLVIPPEKYLRLSIPSSAAEASVDDPFTTRFSDAAKTKLAPYLPLRSYSRPSVSRATSNVSAFSSTSHPATVSNTAANSPQKFSSSQSNPIYSCAICWIRVSGRFFLCPACGHVAHFDCMDDELGTEEGECVVGCGCGCGFEDDNPRSRMEDLIEKARWEERGGWLPEVEFDEEASTRAYRSYDSEDQPKRRKEGKKGKTKAKKKARVSGLSYY